MNHPSELKYASTHEWVKIEGDLVVTGISDHAQDALGDLVYVEVISLRVLKRVWSNRLKPHQIFMHLSLVQ